MPKTASHKLIQELGVAYQINLFVVDEQFDSNEKVYATAFKKLYYHLYSNSNSSRSEKIMSDLSNLLLCKIVCERTNTQKIIQDFLNKQGTANEILLPVLKQAFPHLVGDDEKFYLDDKTLRYGLNELSGLSLQSASAHVMGEAFQALMGPRLRGDKGQFFTPKSLVKSMIAVLHPSYDAKIVDPACGTGGFLVETHTFQTSEFTILLGKQFFGKLIGIDKDKDLCRLAEATLEIVAPERGKVLNLNSLDIKALLNLPENQSPFNADYVLTNPPFGAKIKVTEREILKQFSLGHKWAECESGWRQENQLRDAQDPQILFIELCIKLLKPGGQMGIVLPEGVFGNTNMGFVWDYIRSQGKIIALLDCPRTTFQPSTDTKTNVLFFEKYQNENLPETSNQTWTAVALNCGHDRRGRSHKSTGEAYPDDFLTIGESFKSRATGMTSWQYTEISDPYYLCPRYYDKTPLNELKIEAERLGSELISIREMVKKGYLRIRKGHEVGADAYGTGDVPFIRTSDISNYEISIDPTRSISEEICEKFRELQQLAPNDILMVADGRYRIGKTAILNEYNYTCIVQSHIKIITVTPKSPIDAIEFLYLLNLPMIQHQIRNLVFIQSTLGSLGSRLNEIMLPLPTQNEQWSKTIMEFRQLIHERAELLRKLKDFEHSGYEL